MDAERESGHVIPEGPRRWHRRQSDRLRSSGHAGIGSFSSYPSPQPFPSLFLHRLIEFMRRVVHARRDVFGDAGLLVTAIQFFKRALDSAKFEKTVFPPVDYHQR